MKLLILNSTDPYLNLAIEEYLFLHAEEPILMLWQNACSVIIGKNQNAYAEIDRTYAEEHGIRIARRITGGGAVYHDLGNINYSYISPHEVGGTLDFESYSTPILRALHALGIQASLSGRNDIEVDGKKISGNAQHRSDGRLLHHGTLLFDTDMGVLGSVLRPNRAKLKTRAIRSVGARVTNLRPLLGEDWTKDRFLDHLCRFLESEYDAATIPTPSNSEITALAERNASAEWIYPEKEMLSRYTETHTERYPFGTVEISLSMHREKILDVSIAGDFFGTRPIRELEAMLCGTSLASLEDVLLNCPVSEFIFGMDATALITLLRRETNK